MVFKNRPVRDELPLAQKFICGKQMPAQKYARPERDRMKFIAPIILHATTPFFNCPFGTTFLDGRFTFTHI